MNLRYCLLISLTLLVIQSQEQTTTIIRQLSHPNTTMRKRAVLKLHKLLPTSNNATRALVKCFTDKSKDVRQIAIMTLLKIGEPAMPAVYKALVSKDRATWGTAAGVFIAFKDKAVPFLQKKHSRTRNKLMQQRILYILQQNKKQPAQSQSQPAKKEITPKTEQQPSQSSVISMLKKLSMNDRRRRKLVENKLHQLPTSDIVILVHLIGHREKAISRRAIMALQILGEKAIPAFLKVAESDVAHAQTNMLHVLPKSKAAIPIYIKLIGLPNKNIRENAIIGLSKQYKHATEISKSLDNDNSLVRESITTALGKMGKNAIHATDKLIKALNDDNPKVAQSSLVALTKIGMKKAVVIPSKLIPTLEESLTSDNQTIVMNTLKIIAQTKPSPKINSIEKALNHKKVEVKLFAIDAVANISNSKNTIPTLEKLAKDTNFSVRKKALQTLIKMDNTAAIEALSKALGDKNGDLRSFSYQQLAKIGKEAIPSLVKTMASSNDLARTNCAYAFREMGVSALPTLKTKLKDGDWRVRETAILGICAAKEAEDLVPNLIDALEDSKWEVVCASALTLGRMGEIAREAETALAEIILKNKEGRGPLVQGLAGIMPITQQAINAFSSTITSSRWKTRMWSVRGLGNMRAKAKPMLDILVVILKNTKEYEEIRNESRTAIEKIIGKK